MPALSGQPLLDVEALSAHLAIPIPSLRRMTQRGEILHVRIGRLVHFRPQEIEDWLTARSVPATMPGPPSRRGAEMATACRHFRLS